jgi:flagellar biosynthetic protein FliR
VLISVAGEPLIAYLLASIRIAAWLVVVPPFSSRAFPVQAKVILSVALAMAAAPALTRTTVPTGTYELLASAATQAAVGAAMGMVTYLVFAAISAAGGLIDVFGGFSLAQGFDPLGQNMNSVFGTFHQMLGTMLLFVSGGHLIVIGGLLSTFRFLPVGASPEIDNGTGIMIAAFRVFFTTAVQIALPMVAVLFLADLGLALLTKVAPQLNAINVMFPAKIGLTLLLVGMSFAVLPSATDRLVDLAQQAMAALAGAG